MKKLLPAILLILFTLEFTTNAQGIRDSVFRIQEVSVEAERIFKKENAGMKELRMDSSVLIAKINGSISDVLAENSSVFIKDYGRGALATASFRGTAPAHTQVTWNGLRINSPMLGMVDFSLIPVYVVDEINLQHGAASVSALTGGLGGHILINTKADWKNRFSGRYYQGIGSFSSFDEFLQLNFGNSSIQSKTRLYHNYSENDYNFRNKSIPGYPIEKNRNADFQKYGFTQELYFKSSDKNIISAKLWYQDAYRSIPTVLSNQSSDSASFRYNRQDDNTLKAVIESRYYGTRYKSSFRTGTDVQQLDYRMRTKINGMDDQFPVNSGSNMFSWYNYYSGIYSFDDNFSIRFNANFNHHNISTLDTATQNGYDRINNEFSLFSGAYWSINEKFNLSLQLRKDWARIYDSPIIYSLGISYKPLSDEELIMKAGISRNYHHPTLNDMYWQPGGNPDLLPEKGHTMESGIHYVKELGALKFDNQLTAYYSAIRNWILWLPGSRGYWEPINLWEVRSYGLENHIRLEFSTGETRFQLHGNYALTRSQNYGNPVADGDVSAKKQLPFIPVHSGNIFFSVERKGYYLNYQHNSYSRRYVLSSNRVGMQDNSEDLGLSADQNPMLSLYPYYLNHIAAGKTISFKKFIAGIEIKVNNIFNEEYRSVLQRFMPGRNYTLLLKLDF